jgi:hypothetical protein
MKALALPLVVMPVVGYLLTATIANHFLDRYGPEPANHDQHVVARACQRNGPISWHGFGYWYECRVDGPIGEKTVSFLTPADIGEPVAATVVRKSSGGRSRSTYLTYERAATRPQEGWVALAVAFAGLWIWLVVVVTRRIGQAIDRRNDPKASLERRVRVGHDWRHPLTLSPQGMTWDGDLLPWREVREVRLVGDTMHVRPLVGETVAIGPFARKRLHVVDEALKLFLGKRYSRDEEAEVA